MDTQGFSPSIDWGREVGNSAVWVAIAFLACALVLAAVVVLVTRYTEWGRQFRRITGDYFAGRASVPVWLMIAAMLLSAVLAVRVNVLLSYYANDLFSSLQVAFAGGGSSDAGAAAEGVDAFWLSMVIFAVLATLSAVRFLLDLYLTQRFVLRWRAWLSGRVVDDWLAGHAYFRGQLARHPIDNPDQRIQQDVDIVTAGTGEPNTPAHGSNALLVFGAVESMLSVVSFGVILWNLSGPLTLLDVTLPRALFWIVIGYVSAATVIAFWIGRPLIRFSFLNEMLNAGFRYSMIRLKDSASAVGLYGGEDVEREHLRDRISGIVANYRRWLNRMVLFLGWNLSVSQAINPLPYVVQAQRLFAGQITFGDLMQSAAAFAAIHDALSFFRNAYDQFASYRAALIRLDGLRDEIQRARSMPGVTAVAPTDGGIRVTGVDVHTPDGRALVRSLDLELERGDSLVITGPSGVGKTVLLESIAGLWPHASGEVRMPSTGRAMFLSQLPYLPLGDLRAAVAYPNAPDAIGDAEIQRALVAVALPHLVIRIREVRDWAKLLSIGEQQRVAFARILLTEPAAVFLDESTSALDEGLEMMLYQAVRAELPDAILVSVSHRDTVEQHHDGHLELQGDGGWRLNRLAANTPG